MTCEMEEASDVEIIMASSSCSWLSGVSKELSGNKMVSMALTMDYNIQHFSHVIVGVVTTKDVMLLWQPFFTCKKDRMTENAN